MLHRIAYIKTNNNFLFSGLSLLFSQDEDVPKVRCIFLTCYPKYYDFQLVLAIYLQL